MADFKVRFAENGKTFPVKFTGEGKQFPAAMGEVQVVTVGAAPYEGEYVVEPDFVGKTLETANKLMQENVTVNPIMVSETSNHSGGKTIYIGGMIKHG